MRRGSDPAVHRVELLLDPVVISVKRILDNNLFVRGQEYSL